MAKKSFNISSTLKKNKESLEPKLPEKVELKKKRKNFDEIKEKVEEIHDGVGADAPVKEVPVVPATPIATPASTEVAAVAPPAKEKPVVKSSHVPKRKPSNTVKERMVRMTIDTPEAMHRRLKIMSIEKGVSMRDLILRLIEREIKKG